MAIQLCVLLARHNTALSSLHPNCHTPGHCVLELSTIYSHITGASNNSATLRLFPAQLSPRYHDYAYSRRILIKPASTWSVPISVGDQGSLHICLSSFATDYLRGLHVAPVRAPIPPPATSPCPTGRGTVGRPCYLDPHMLLPNALAMRL
jgi:hypothetical protein